MTSRISHTAIDATDAYAQSVWWSKVLGFSEDPDDPNEPGHEMCLIMPAERNPVLLFITVPEGKELKNRLHFDLRPVDRSRDGGAESGAAGGRTRPGSVPYFCREGLLSRLSTRAFLEYRNLRCFCEQTPIREQLMAATSVPACDFVIFGGTGDLALRKLLPALYLRYRDGQLPDDFRVIGLSRSGLGSDGYRGKVGAELYNHLPAAVLTEDHVAAFLQRLDFVTADAEGSGDWAALTTMLDAMPGRIRVFYLSCAPRLYGPISRKLADNGLVSEQSRVVLEKPIGTCLATAREI
ncbi:MAG: VOC family protein, partial [Streptosporangiaceae bacterium]